MALELGTEEEVVEEAGELEEAVEEGIPWLLLLLVVVTRAAAAAAVVRLAVLPELL